MDTNRRTSKDDQSRIDWGIIFCVLMLACIGLASIYVAATHDSSATSVLRQVISQLVWYVIGIVAVIIIMQFDSEQLWKVAPIVYWAGIALLASVLILYSRAYYVNTGAKSWFSIFGLTFQPSEVMKPAYILMMGRVIVQHNDNYPIRSVRSDWLLLGKMILWTIPIAVLLKLQNDFGTMLVFFAILGGLIIVSGITWKIILPAMIVIFGTAGTALALVIPESGRQLLEKIGFQAYQFSRVDTWLHPSADTSNQGYQLWQSMKAIGSGGIFGTGFNQSHVYVPVRESDMIFSVIGENFGFIGSCILILLYFLLIYQMIKVTFDTRNVFFMHIFQRVLL